MGRSATAADAVAEGALVATGTGADADGCDDVSSARGQPMALNRMQLTNMAE
jgi:hypothetical protein